MMLKDTINCLHRAICSGDRARALRASSELQFGILWLNKLSASNFASLMKLLKDNRVIASGLWRFALDSLTTSEVVFGKLTASQVRSVFRVVVASYSRLQGPFDRFAATDGVVRVRPDQSGLKVLDRIAAQLGGKWDCAVYEGYTRMAKKASVPEIRNAASAQAEIMAQSARHHSDSHEV